MSVKDTLQLMLSFGMLIVALASLVVMIISLMTQKK